MPSDRKSGPRPSSPSPSSGDEDWWPDFSHGPDPAHGPRPQSVKTRRKLADALSTTTTEKETRITEKVTETEITVGSLNSFS